MQFYLFQNAPPWYKLILTVFVSLSCLMFFYILALILAVPLFHISIKEITNLAFSDLVNSNIGLLKYLQFFQALGSFLVPAFILGFIFSGSATSYLRINQNPRFYTLWLVIISLIIAIPIINYSGYLNSKLELPSFLSGVEKKMVHLEQEAAKLTELLLRSSTTSDYLVNLLIIAVLPALSEEFIFRGVIQKLFTEWTKNSHLGIFIGAAIFSFLHLQFFGFLPRLLLGIYFGYLFFWTNSIWVPVLAHFINNATAVTFYHFLNQKKNMSSLDKIGNSGEDIFFLISSVFLFSFITLTIYNYEKTQKIRKD